MLSLTRKARFFPLIFVVLLSFSGLLYAGEKVDQSIPIDKETKLSLSFPRGQVTLIGWQKNTIQVKGEVDDHAKTFVIKKKAATIFIQVNLQVGNSYISPGRATKLEIHLPRRFFVDLESVTGSVDATEVEGGMKLKIDSGKINLKQVKKNIDIQNISGSIQVDANDAALSIESVSSKILLKGLVAKLLIKSVYSNIEVHSSPIVFSKISTVNGSIKLFATLESHGEVSLENTSGETSFYVTDELNAKVSLLTGPGGDILNQYSKDKPTSSVVTAEELVFSEGDASGRVRMTTQNGKLILKKSF